MVNCEQLPDENDHIYWEVNMNVFQKYFFHLAMENMYVANLV
jgi:hypothetical protein